MSMSRNSDNRMSVDRVLQPKQYSLEFTAEGEQGSSERVSSVVVFSFLSVLVHISAACNSN